jgi:uncharacterized protein (TIGR00375 family)
MIIADFHLHSKFSRACSKNLDIQNLEKWGRVKGLSLLGSSDFTHPKWIEELKGNLKEDTTGQDGIFKTSSGYDFLLQTEISLMYSEGGRGRRIHLVVLAPSFDVVDQITEYLKGRGRIDYDGRPIFKIPCDEFTYDLKKISEYIEIIPAHCLTPWFSIFGSSSGYDTVKDCFKDQEKNIFALETGMSADPGMIYRVADWRKYALVSNSDSHSFWPWRIGREATIFDMKKLTYRNIIHALRNKEIKATVEVDPSYGKYHYTGHRKCGFVVDPAHGLKINNICPRCNSGLTVGVSARVEELADKPEGYYPKDAPRYYSLLPLTELISGQYKYTLTSKKSWEVYNKLLGSFGTEFNILLKTPYDDLVKTVDDNLARLILLNRDGKIKLKPGFDGLYGVPLIHGDEDYDFASAGDGGADIQKRDVKEKKVKKIAEKKPSRQDAGQASLGKYF